MFTQMLGKLYGASHVKERDKEQQESGAVEVTYEGGAGGEACEEGDGGSRGQWHYKSKDIFAFFFVIVQLRNSWIILDFLSCNLILSDWN